MSRRVGPLSNKEKHAITDYSNTLSPTEIAEKLNRNIETVIGYQKEYLTKNPKSKLEHEARDNLRLRPEWKFWQKQFTEDELKYFEYAYGRLVAQFNNDITVTEEKQIFQIIEVEILTNSVKAERRRTIQDIEYLSSIVKEEMKKDKDQRDTDLIVSCEQQLQMADAANHSRLAKYTDLTKQSQSLMDDLKGTRNQRVKNIEHNQKSIIDYIKELEQDEYRQSQGQELELMKLASSKEFDRLAGYHQYMNEEYDRPLLTPETVMLEDK